MANIRKDYYPKDISLALYALTGGPASEAYENVQRIAPALYNLMAISENEYNDDSYRHLWDCLQKIADMYERGKIKIEE